MLKVDVAISGAGPVGLIMAQALTQKGLDVALIDSGCEENIVNQDITQDPHIRAITPSNIAWLHQLNIWSSLPTQGYQTYHRMHVWQGDGVGSFTMHAHEHRLPYLGAMASLSALKRASLSQVASSPWCQMLWKTKVTGWESQKNGLLLHLDKQDPIHTRLHVIAQGALSPLRQQLGIAHQTSPYPHRAMAGRIETEKPHQNTAWQVFTEGYILGLLPTSNPQQMAFVCSYPKDKPTTPEKLASLSQHRFGQIKTLCHFDFPLQAGHAQTYYQDRHVLVGDAVANIHPLAGQGLNLGLHGAERLCTNIISAYQQSDDWGNAHVLKNYQRHHRRDVLTKLGLMRALSETLGQKKSGWIEKIKNDGMLVFDKCGWMKEMVIRQVL